MGHRVSRRSLVLSPCPPPSGVAEGSVVNYLSEDGRALLGFQSAVDSKAQSVSQRGELFSVFGTNLGL